MQEGKNIEEEKICLNVKKIRIEKKLKEKNTVETESRNYITTLNTPVAGARRSLLKTGCWSLLEEFGWMLKYLCWGLISLTVSISSSSSSREISSTAGCCLWMPNVPRRGLLMQFALPAKKRIYRVECPNFGHPALTSSFKQYDFLQVKISFATIVNELSV